MKNKVLALLLAAMMSVSLLGSTTLAAELLPAPGASANSGEVTPAVPPEEEEKDEEEEEPYPDPEEEELPAIYLADKTAVYTGSEIIMEEAEAVGGVDVDEIYYTYYVNAQCTEMTTPKNAGVRYEGDAPVYAGTYYVLAENEEDGLISSNVAVLTITKVKSTIALKNKDAAYTGKAVSIGAASVTGSKGKVTYTYYTDSACTQKTTKSNSGASANGKAPKKKGTYYVKAKVAADRNGSGATSKPAVLTIGSKAQTITLSTTAKSYTENQVKEAKKSFSIGAKATAGKITCKKTSGSSKLTVSSSGKVTVAKGTAAGTYQMKVKITAAATKLYRQATTTKTITVTVTSSTPADTDASGSGSVLSDDATVYVSDSGKIHQRSDCSGMKYSTAMTYAEAKSRNYEECKNCFQ